MSESHKKSSSKQLASSSRFTFAPLSAPREQEPKARSGTGTTAQQPLRKKAPPKLEAGFDKKLLELEFSVEKCATAESVTQLLALYNTAITHYDTANDRSLAEIFRAKVAMLFAKPSVMQIFGAGLPPTKAKE